MRLSQTHPTMSLWILLYALEDSNAGIEKGLPQTQNVGSKVLSKMSQYGEALRFPFTRIMWLA